MKIKIDNKFYDFFDEVAIDLSLDAIASTFSFKAKFDTNNVNHQLIFQPLIYSKVEIFNDFDNLIFTGVIVNTQLQSSATPTIGTVSGYSIPGVLEDSTIPYSGYPLEKNNVSLHDVVRGVLRDFNINYTVHDSVAIEMNLNYKKTVASPSETVKSYIAKLAAQRNIVLSHTNRGELLFFRPNAYAKPKLFLNKENTLSMSLSVNGQGIHSEISVIRQPSKKNNNLKPVDFVLNPMVFKYKPVVKTLSSGEDTDTKNAANNILADELKNISFSVNLNRIEDLNPGDIVEVQNDEIFLFKRTKLMVSKVSIKENTNSKSMSISLLMPETFTGDAPNNIFVT